MAYKVLNQQISIKHVLNGQKQHKGVSEQQIFITCASSFGLYPLLEVILYRLLSFGGARWLTVVQSREVSASWRFQIYSFYRKSNRGMDFVRPYRGCPPSGDSVIRGFTVVYTVGSHCFEPDKPQHVQLHYG